MVSVVVIVVRSTLLVQSDQQEEMDLDFDDVDPLEQCQACIYREARTNVICGDSGD